MRYRVNLYRERAARGERLKRSLFRGTLLGVVVAVEIVLLGALVVSGFQFRERAEAVRSATRALEERSRPYRENEDLAAARALVRQRVERVDWSVLLAAVAGRTPDDIVLSEVKGGRQTGRGALDGLEIEGRLTGRGTDLASVIAYVDSLRSDPRITRWFPRIDLGEARGGSGQNFLIVCRPPGGEETP